MDLERKFTHAPDGRTRLARNVEAMCNRLGVERTATAVGMNRTNLYKWKMAKKLFDSIETLWKLADIAHCSVDELIGRPAPTSGGMEFPALPTPEPAPPPSPDAVETEPVPPSVEKAGENVVLSIVVDDAMASMLCCVCLARVVFPESTPGYHLAAAIERFRRNHADCYRKGENRGEAS